MRSGYLRWKVLTFIAVGMVAVLAEKAWEKVRQAGEDTPGESDALTVNNNVVISTAERLGIRVRKLPGGFLELRKGGRVSYSIGADFDFENVVSWKMCGDKMLSAMLLMEQGLPVPKFATFSPLAYGEALRVFAGMRKPVVVKPRKDTCGGVGVTTGIYSERDFQRAFVIAGSYRKDVMIEEFVPGDNFRVLILDGHIISIVKRNRLYVVGDGKRSLRQLINADLVYNIGQPRPRNNKVLDNDARQFFKNNRITLDNVPQDHEVFFFKMVCNGGRIEGVRDITHDDYRNLALKAAEVIGAKLCSVELIAQDISRPMASGNCVVNEVNTSPHLYINGEPLGPMRPSQAGAEEILRKIFPIGS